MYVCMYVCMCAYITTVAATVRGSIDTIRNKREHLKGRLSRTRVLQRGRRARPEEQEGRLDLHGRRHDLRRHFALPSPAWLIGPWLEVPNL